MKRPDWFLLGMLLAVVLAWLLPAPGAKGGSLHPELLNKLGVSLIFFLHGLTLSFAALGAGARNWRLHLLVQACTFLLCPLLGVLLIASIGGHLSVDLRTGLFFLCALPSTVSSSVALTATAKGNVPAAVFNATLSSLLGVVLTPLWLSLVLGAAGRALPIASVIVDLVEWLVLPLFIGQLLRPLLGAFATRHRTRIGVLDRLTILLLVYTSFCDSVQDGVWRAGDSALLISLLSSIVLLAATMLIVWQISRASTSRPQIASLRCSAARRRRSPRACRWRGSSSARTQASASSCCRSCSTIRCNSWSAAGSPDASRAPQLRRSPPQTRTNLERCWHSRDFL